MEVILKQEVLYSLNLTGHELKLLRDINGGMSFDDVKLYTDGSEEAAVFSNSLYNLIANTIGEK